MDQVGKKVGLTFPPDLDWGRCDGLTVPVGGRLGSHEGVDDLVDMLEGFSDEETDGLSDELGPPCNFRDITSAFCDRLLVLEKSWISCRGELLLVNLDDLQAGVPFLGLFLLIKRTGFSSSISLSSLVVGGSAEVYAPDGFSLSTLCPVG